MESSYNIKTVSNTSKWSYSVKRCDTLLDVNNPTLKNEINDRLGLIITTPTVANYYGSALDNYLTTNNISFPVEIIPLREDNKLIDAVLDVTHLVKDHCIDRKGVIIGFGGGVCTDIVTMSASIIRRGISYIRIPTTLIGQIDASIGIKGAVNYETKKSYLGCFYPPETVLIDPSFLSTLQYKHIIAGFAEIIKMAMIGNSVLFELIENYAPTLIQEKFSNINTTTETILEYSIVDMLDHLETNFYENKTYQRYVDMGHTFSPLIESKLEFDIQHGEAVAIDLAFSSIIAKHLNMLEANSCLRILKLIHSCHLPLYTNCLTVDLCRKAIDDTLLHRGGDLNLPVPTDVGSSAFIVNPNILTNELLLNSIKELENFSMEVNQNKKDQIYQSDTLIELETI